MMYRLLSMSMLLCCIVVYPVYAMTEDLCSFAWLSRAIKDAQPHITITLSCPEPIRFTSPIMIDKPLTIDWQGAILDGWWQSRLFIIAKQVWWIIDGRLNPTPQQGWAGIHVSFKNMTWQNARGASFRFAERTNKPETTTDWSALYVGMWWHATLENITAKNNQSPTDGGVIYIHGGNSGKLTIRNSSFDNNRAGWGWSVIASQQAAEVNIYTTQFIANTSACTTEACLKGERGWAVRVRAWGILHVDNALFSWNKANLGWAINILQTAFSISNSRFFNNESLPGRVVLHNQSWLVNDPTMNETRGWWAIYADTSKRGKSEILNSYFEGNKAQMDGWAIYMYLRDAHLTISNSQFIANHVLKARGAALGIYGKTTITDTHFSANTVWRPDQHTKGRIIYPEWRDLTLIRSDISQTTPPPASNQPLPNTQSTTQTNPPSSSQPSQSASSSWTAAEQTQITTLVAHLRSRKNRLTPIQRRRLRQRFVQWITNTSRLTSRQKDIWNEALKQVP